MKNNTIKFLFILLFLGIINNPLIRASALLNDSIVTPPDTSLANFSFSKMGDGAFQFKDSSSLSNITTYYWEFGDGSSSNLKNPSHQYTNGIFKATVCLNIGNSKGLFSSRCKVIEVRKDTTGTCSAWFSIDSISDTRFRFTDLSTGSDKITLRNWTISGDSRILTDSVLNYTFDSTLTSATVCLNISTSKGCQSSFCRTLTLKSLCNYFDIRYEKGLNGKVQFYPYSPISSIIGWDWRFGDGDSSTQIAPVHTYVAGINEANVCLTLTNVNGSCTKCQLIQLNDTVIADSCRADFSYIKSAGDSSKQYIFTDVSSTMDPIVWRQWSMPDDSTFNSDTTFFHTFNASLSSAEVCLSIRTSSGCQSSICKTLQLNDTIVPSNCQADFTYIVALDSTMSGLAWHRVYFQNTSTYTDKSAKFWNWNFGDGTYSTLQNPAHTYSFLNDTVISVSLIMYSASGCNDSIEKLVTIPSFKRTFTLAGTVVGSGEMLQQGIIVLYKKLANGLYTIQDANVINNGVFSFEKLNTGKYILYAEPHMYLTNKYLPTYYVNKLHWKDATVINLASNIGGLTLKMVSQKSIGKGICKISGIVNNSDSSSNTLKLQSAAGVSVPVYLYTQSGEAITMAMTDANGAFEFSELPYGSYTLKIEYLNLEDNATPVSLSTETPETSGIIFNITNNVLGVDKLTQVASFSVRNIGDDKVGISINQGGTYTVSMVSLSGKTIVNNKTQFESNTEKEVYVGSLPKGIYVVKLQSKNGMLTKKILK